MELHFIMDASCPCTLRREGGRSMHPELERVLLDADRLAAKVAELGRRITQDYADKQILLVGILKGSVPFLADLARQIDLDVTFDFMAISSYGASSESSGVVRFIKD